MNGMLGRFGNRILFFSRIACVAFGFGVSNKGPILFFFISDVDVIYFVYLW